MRRAALERLARLAEARRARDLAQIERLAGERRRLEAEVAEIAIESAREAAAGALPFALIAQRETWTRASIEARERRIGVIAGDIECLRAAARISVGRHQAVLALAEAARSEAAARTEKRAEIEALAARDPSAHRLR